MSLARPICAFYHMQRPYIHISREMGSLRTGNLKVLFKVVVKWNKRKIYLVIHSHVLFYITFTIMCIQCLLLLPVVSVNSIAITGLYWKNASQRTNFFLFLCKRGFQTRKTNCMYVSFALGKTSVIRLRTFPCALAVTNAVPTGLYRTHASIQRWLKEHFHLLPQVPSFLLPRLLC